MATGHYSGWAANLARTNWHTHRAADSRAGAALDAFESINGGQGKVSTFALPRVHLGLLPLLCLLLNLFATLLMNNVLRGIVKPTMR
jgi:hypothetical protein